MSVSAVSLEVIADAVAASRSFLRTDGAEDALIGRLAATTIALGEAFTGGVFVSRPCEDVLSASGGWQRLAAEPVSAIAGVTRVPVDGAPSVLAAGDYAIDIDDDGRGWVRVIAPDAGRVAVSYTAGLAARWDALPAPIAHGIVMLTAHLYADREGDAPPAAVSALWRPFRRMSLATAAHRS